MNTKCETCDVSGQCKTCKPGDEEICEEEGIISCPRNCLGCNSVTKQCNSCVPGFWGSSCNATCPDECATCVLRTGSCSTCLSGFWGISCTEHCLVQHCFESSCTKSSGECAWCTEGWWGKNCEHICDDFNCIQIKAQAYAKSA